MDWEQQYRSREEEYLRLTDRYDVRFEYWDGVLRTQDGSSVILLGGVAPTRTLPDTALVVISNATKEEVEKLSAFVATLRKTEK